MTNRRRFFINGIILTAVGLAIRSVSLGFNSFITQSIGAEGIGLFTLISTVYSFAITFATSGISLTVTRLVASAIGEGKPERVGRVLKGSFIYSLIFGLVATLGLFLGADFFGNEVQIKANKTLPFNSKRKLSAVTFENNQTYAFGAPEFVLNNSEQR